MISWYFTSRDFNMMPSFPLTLGKKPSVFSLHSHTTTINGEDFCDPTAESCADPSGLANGTVLL